jgi:hypothetical protein
MIRFFLFIILFSAILAVLLMFLTQPLKFIFYSLRHKYYKIDKKLMKYVRK